MTEKADIVKLPKTFELLDESGIGLDGADGLLNERERRLLVGAANFHALAGPGRTFRFTVLRGPSGTLPSLTDEACHQIGWADDREVVGSMVVRSLVHTTAKFSPADGLVDLVVDLGGEPRLASAYDQLPGLLGKARRTVRFMAPVQFDALRQFRTDVVERRHRTRPVPRKAPVRLARGAAARRPATKPAVLFGLHWLELGGAERWALETVQMAREAGMVPIVITDRPSSHSWIERPELEGAVIVPLTHPTSPEQESAFLNGVLSTYDVRGVHLHHCTWLYERLPWLKSIRPDIPVVDSLHILEWRTGGFVDISVRMSNMIDKHHVISPQLRDYLVGRQGVEPEKVELATLATLTTAGIERPGRVEGAADPFTVSFVGRFTQQKRPYLFLQLAAELRATAPGRVRFVMHGDGELAGEVMARRDRLGLADVLEVRGPDQPVARTLAETDALVISSDNEGLTLTSFEATAAGVPVVSTDVGSQASLIADDLLCPRHPFPFVRLAAERLRTMMTSPDQRKTWLDEQAVKAEAFAKLPDARTWTRDLYEGWLK
ncbi:Glycosyltransferase involved in cell wall bisynthesis [Streptoalloteichus hindustanus]|uniref:Glycosyltransferase involved in cell wall bisynthesis n=1 Tax=Streptoalloteichus hindustanus TaxID=2017 RepID=A0A1M4VI99_STRHI|nr:Glycosyltransferase involved in cell wall bisynthesis [Streptoalloteichus hindustanus]